MTPLRSLLPISVLLFACGPEPIGEDDDVSDPTESSTSDDTTEGESGTSESSTSDTSTSDTSTSDTSTSDTTDTGVDTDGFGNGEDSCEGDRFGECVELGWADLTAVVLSDADQDGAWSPGEALTATVTYASTGDFINYPAVVSQSDNPLVTVPWATSGFFGVVPGQPIEYQVVFEADPAIEPGTQVGLHIGAATGLGQITACDCPDVMVDAWIEYVTIE